MERMSLAEAIELILGDNRAVAFYSTDDDPRYARFVICSREYWDELSDPNGPATVERAQLGDG